MSRIHNYPHLPPLRISVPSGSDQTLCLSLVSYTKGTIEFFRRSILNHRPRHLGICFSPRQCIGNTVHLFPVATTALPLARLTSHRPLARLRREARATGKDTVPAGCECLQGVLQYYRFVQPERLSGTMHYCSMGILFYLFA